MQESNLGILLGQKANFEVLKKIFLIIKKLQFKFFGYRLFLVNQFDKELSIQKFKNLNIKKKKNLWDTLLL